ncbi:MAG: adenine nucleotide alpha hydrolase family protein [Anaerolineae bacterium]|nr:adenine nucleotide alpha hydrolase family protein [Anaerolineae bacterium]
MKCNKCAQRAVFTMRHYKLSLCETHYMEWFVSHTGQTIQKYHLLRPDERVLIAVSGGKDSLSLWDVLIRLGYAVDGLYIDLGIDGGFGYSALSHQKIDAFMAGHPETRLHVVDLAAEYGATLPQIAGRKRRGREKPCALCGLIKRHEMNRIAQAFGYDVLVTGHNLDDEAAVLFSNVLHWHTGYIARQAPVLEERTGLARKVKPLCRAYEREVAAYALIRGIDYIYEECPYVEGSRTLMYKGMLDQLEEEAAGTKLQFYVTFLHAKKDGFFRDEEALVELHPCDTCGQPTIAPGSCAFCRIWKEPER